MIHRRRNICAISVKTNVYHLTRGVFWFLEETMAGPSAEAYDVCLSVHPFGGRLCCCCSRCDLFYRWMDGEGGGGWISLQFGNCLKIVSMNYKC